MLIVMGRQPQKSVMIKRRKTNIMAKEGLDITEKYSLIFTFLILNTGKQCINFQLIIIYKQFGYPWSTKALPIKSYQNIAKVEELTSRC